jgi:two-component system, NtrC family, nitrogen regulation sensor histidine kinase GlnL
MPARSDNAWPDLEPFATAMAVVDGALGLRAINPAMHDWLAAGTRNWRGEPLALLDAQPPRLCDAATRAFGEQRRVWLRGARLRSAIGDRGADVAFTPIARESILLELQPATADASSGPRLSESLRGFAHEVRNPLAGLRGAAQLLQRRAADAESADLAGLIVGEADRLAALSERLLHAGGKPRLARTNPHEVIERVIALMTAAVDSPRMRRDYDPSLPALPLDADRLQQALLNLGRNAVEAGARELTWRTRAEHHARLGDHAGLALRIDLADDGHGVPAAIADSLFEPLVSGRAGGSGLGLALAREIAVEHGGELGHAGRPGATVFSLLLPIAAASGGHA